MTTLFSKITGWTFLWVNNLSSETDIANNIRSLWKRAKNPALHKELSKFSVYTHIAALCYSDHSLLAALSDSLSFDPESRKHPDLSAETIRQIATELENLLSYDGMLHIFGAFHKGTSIIDKNRDGVKLNVVKWAAIATLLCGRIYQAVALTEDESMRAFVWRLAEKAIEAAASGAQTVIKTLKIDDSLVNDRYIGEKITGIDFEIKLSKQRQNEQELRMRRATQQAASVAWWILFKSEDFRKLTEDEKR